MDLRAGDPPFLEDGAQFRPVGLRLRMAESEQPGEGSRMVQRHLVILNIVVILTGCGSAAQYVYSKPGVTEEQRERDKAECLFGSTETVPGRDGPGRRVNTARYERCMADRGYTLEKATE